MEIKANLNNLRISPRKVRQVAALVKGMKAGQAKEQLTFLVKKPAPIILKLLNSAIANAKHNFSIEQDDLYIKSLSVNGGPSLKRWLPRAMGRATPLLKRTSSIKMILDEIKTGTAKKGKAGKEKEREEKEPKTALPQSEIENSPIDRKEQIKEEAKGKKSLIQKPHDSSSKSKNKNFTRQPAGNLKKVFRRKSI
jgi:large subunit ribosomal protein L22